MIQGAFRSSQLASMRSSLSSHQIVLGDLPALKDATIVGWYLWGISINLMMTHLWRLVEELIEPSP